MIIVFSLVWLALMYGSRHELSGSSVMKHWLPSALYWGVAGSVFGLAGLSAIGVFLLVPATLLLGLGMAWVSRRELWVGLLAMGVSTSLLLWGYVRDRLFCGEDSASQYGCRPATAKEVVLFVFALSMIVASVVLGLWVYRAGNRGRMRSPSERRLAKPLLG